MRSKLPKMAGGKAVLVATTPCWNGEAAALSAPKSATVHPLKEGTGRPQLLDSAAIKQRLRDYNRVS